MNTFRFQFLLFPFLLLIFCWVSYANTLNNAYMLDDIAFLHSGYDETYQKFSDYFFVNTTHHYYPVYFMVDMFLFNNFKEHPWLLHGVSIMLFYGSALLFYMLLTMTLRNDFLAFLSALLLIVHPIHSFLVNNISSNFVLISAIFMEISLIGFWQYLIRLGRIRYGYFLLSLLFFILALLTFEASILLPLYIMILAYFLARKDPSQTILYAVPFFIIAGVFLCIWYQMSGGEANFLHKFHQLELTLGAYLASLLFLIFWYLSNLVLPFDIVFMKNIAPVREFVWGWDLLMLAFALLIVYILLRLGKDSVKTMGLVWFLPGLLLVAGGCLFHADMGLVIEPHWLYFSSLGLFLAFASILHDWRGKIPRGWVALPIVVCLYFGIATQNYNRLARTEKGYCLHWLAKSPGNIIAILRLGELSYFEGNYDKALSYISFAATKYTGTMARSRILHNLGVIYQETGREDLAEQHFRLSISANPKFLPPHEALKLLKSKKGSL